MKRKFALSPFFKLPCMKVKEDERSRQKIQEPVSNKVLSAVTAPLAACCSTRAPARASVLLNAGKGELPVCNAAYKGGKRRGIAVGRGAQAPVSLYH